MGALPIGHIGFWLAKSNVGVWSCGRQITGVISRLRAPDRKSWPRLGNWAVRGPSCNPPAGHCKRIRRVCFILHFTNTRQNKLPKWPPFRVEKVSPNRWNKGGWAPAPTVRGTGGGGAGRHEWVDRGVALLPPVAGGRAVGTRPVEGVLSTPDDAGDGLSQFPSSDRAVKGMSGQWLCHGQDSTADQQNRCAPSGACRYGSENSECWRVLGVATHVAPIVCSMC